MIAASANVGPLIFDSYYRPQVWGGRALNQLLGRSLPDDSPYGEAWDISPQKLHVSRVIGGPYSGRDLNDLWTNCDEISNGQGRERGFPLLVKWLECCEQLSLQVHPDDSMAQRILGEPFGKTEAWVVISAEPTARVYAGLKPNVTKADIVSHLATGTLAECLHSFIPKSGDCISLPAGTVHAAGGGLVIAEVQQSSDATFRLYDWNRLGLDGKPRDLQVDLALEAVDWNQGPVSPVVPKPIPLDVTGVTGEHLVETIAFRLERYEVQTSFLLPYEGELTIWMILDGKGILRDPITGNSLEFNKGGTTMIPAASNRCVWESKDKNVNLSLLCVRLQTGSKDC